MNKTAVAEIISALHSLSMTDLEQLIAAATKTKADMATACRESLLEEFRERAARIGVSLAELVFGGHAAKADKPKKEKRKDERTVVAAKYRGPNGEAWTGRGRTPRWLVALEADGKRREAFLL